MSLESAQIQTSVCHPERNERARQVGLVVSSFKVALLLV